MVVVATVWLARTLRGALETEKNATVGKCRRDLGGKPLLVLEGLPRLAGIRVCTDLAAP